jgi:glucosamine--fructose-6-phosphate aminotransferase (isomerizing)
MDLSPSRNQEYWLHRLWKTLRVFLRVPPIYVGSAPLDAPNGSWILFPYQPHAMGCGLTAIIEIKSKTEETSCRHDFAKLLTRQRAIQGFTDLLPDPLANQSSPTFLDILEQGTMLRDDASFCALTQDVEQQRYLRDIADLIKSLIEREEAANLETTASSAQETRNALLIRLKDIWWRIVKEFFMNLSQIEDLLGCKANEVRPELIRTFRHLNSIFNILDRLEVRGRDSAGLVLTITFSEENYAVFSEALHQRSLDEEIVRRQKLTELVSLSIKDNLVDKEHQLAFLFKVALEIGKLGENVQLLRQMVKEDRILRVAIETNPRRIGYLSHTRWASNGIINIFNCHPVDNEVVCQNDRHLSHQVAPFPQAHPHYPVPGHIFVVLNGDIDNYEELKIVLEQENGLQISPRITTDTKIIPLQIERFLRTGVTLAEAFRQAVNSFHGSHAIAMQSDLEPGKTFLALKGSGQAIYIGIGSDRYVVASEVYGVIEDTNTYLSMDGETPRLPERPETQGQIFILDEDKGKAEEIVAMYYDGVAIPVTKNMLRHASITTRDIDRQHFPHFFVKEIYQAPYSVRKTVQGKFRLYGDSAVFQLDESMFPARLKTALCEGRIAQICCIGQGTASIAAMTIAYQMQHTLHGSGIKVWGMKASEFSGFHLEPLMQDTLVVAVTQSGTTTDTNRAVDMAKKRGALTMAIVNRRNSHITTMVDGIFYTSDGRDIEMAVASTKAFYAQVAAGEILTLAVAQMLSKISSQELIERLKALQQLPHLLQQVLDKEDEIAQIAGQWAPRHMHWAVVGSGANRNAAEEVRIKLSELCYKSIPCDAVEDKKHIDLSSEPMIVVCAAGTPDSVLGDIVKDVAIFKAHRALPIVIVHVGEERFTPYAAGVIHVPAAGTLSSVVLNTIAGHLFGYHAACSIQTQSRFFSSLRASISTKVAESSWHELCTSPEMQQTFSRFLRDFHRRRREGMFTAALSLSTSVELVLLLNHACGKLPPQQFTDEFGEAATPENLGKQLIEKLSRAVDEMSRSIDAIKHQAKTVTVGTSRLEPTTGFSGVLFDILSQLGVSAHSLRADIAAQLLQLQPAVAQVSGYTCYRVRNLSATGQPTAQSMLELTHKGGIAKNLTSRAEKTPVPLIGSKRAVVQKGEVFRGLGLSDQRPIMIIPLTDEEGIISKLVLFHLAFVQQLDAEKAVGVLAARYLDVQNIITEANIAWRDELLLLLTPEFLYTRDADEIAREILRLVRLLEKNNCPSVTKQ